VPAMTGFPNAAAWRKACAADAVLGTWAGPWSTCFAILSGGDTTIFNFVKDGSPTIKLLPPSS
jgi:hypothetical protein